MEYELSNFDKDSLVYPSNIIVKSKNLTHFVKILKEMSINIYGNKIFFRLDGEAYEENGYYCQPIFLKKRSVKINVGENMKKLVDNTTFSSKILKLDEKASFEWVRSNHYKNNWDFKIHKGKIECRLTNTAFESIFSKYINSYYKTNY